MISFCLTDATAAFIFCLLAGAPAEMLSGLGSTVKGSGCDPPVPFRPLMASFTLPLALVIVSFREDVDRLSLAMGPVGVAGGADRLAGVALGVEGMD